MGPSPTYFVTILLLSFTISLIPLGGYRRTQLCFIIVSFPNFPGQVNNQVVWKSILDLERVLEWRVLGEAEIVVERYLLAGF